MFLQAGVSRFDSLNNASQINLELWKLKEFMYVMVWLVTTMEVAKTFRRIKLPSYSCKVTELYIQFFSLEVKRSNEESYP